MAQYRITAPTGETYQITAPDDATQDQVMAYVQAQHQQMRSPTAQPGDVTVTPANGVTEDTPSLGQRVHDVIAQSPYGKALGMSDTGTAPALVQQASRAGQLGLRNTGAGLASVPDIVLAPAAAIANKGLDLAGVNPQYRFGTAQQATNTALTAAGAPNIAPATSAETYAGAGERALGGVIGGNIAGGVLAGSANPTAQAIGTALQANPGQQAQAALTGAAGAQAAQNAGAGPGGQMAAGVLSALAPAGAAAAAGNIGRVINAVGVQPATEAGRQALRANYVGNIAGAPLALEQSSVPGVQRTLAESSANPGVAQLQRALANQPENAADFGQLAAQNNAARQAYLTQHFGTPEDLATAIANRGDEAAQLYGTARAVDQARIEAAQAQASQNRSLTGAAGANIMDNGAIKPSPELQALAQRPAVQQAIQDAKTVSANRGVPFTSPLQSVQGLHLVKMALDDTLNTAPQQGIGAAAQGSIKNARDALTAEIDKISPDYAAARQAYKDASVPINQMQVGQALIAKGSGNLTDPNTGLPSLQPNAFAGAMNNADKIAASATGNKQATLASTLTPAQQDALTNVQGDLNRVAYAQNAGRAVGSNTGQNILSANALDNIAQAAGVPGLANTKIAQSVLKPLDKIYNLFGVADDLKQGLTRVMLDPTSPEAAATWAKIPPAQRTQVMRSAAPYVSALRTAQQSASAPAQAGGR